MTGYYLPLTEDSWQVFTMDLTIDGKEFHAQVELRYLPATNHWFLSIWDHSTSELLVNMIPVICSYGKVNNLVAPFKHVRNGAGLGTLFCYHGPVEISNQDPGEDDLLDFQILWGDTDGYDADAVS